MSCWPPAILARQCLRRGAANGTRGACAPRKRNSDGTEALPPKQATRLPYNFCKKPFCFFYPCYLRRLDLFGRLKTFSRLDALSRSKGNPWFYTKQSCRRSIHFGGSWCVAELIQPVQILRIVRIDLRKKTVRLVVEAGCDVEILIDKEERPEATGCQD